jgi:hypothetical protein
VTQSRYWPDHPRIALVELLALEHDPESARRFEHRFVPPLVGGLVLLTLGFGGAALLYGRSLIGGGAVAVLMTGTSGAAIAMGVWRQWRMPRTRPVSARSGLPMEPFIIRDVESTSHYELAYVDRASASYFRKIYAQLGE